MHLRRLALLATATALMSGAFASPAAGAVTLLPADIEALPRAGAVESGFAELKLAPRAVSRLRAARGSLSGTGEVRVKGSTVTLIARPEAEVWIDPTTMAGSMEINGALRIRGRTGTATLRAMTFSPGKDRVVTAKLGKRTLTLGRLTGGRATFSKQADGVLRGARLALSAGAAKAINRVTGGGVSAGTFASVTVSVTTRELPLASGVAKVTLDPAILQLLSESGYGISAVAPATIDGAVITIPLTGGAFDPIDLTGRLALEGTVRLENAADGRRVDLFGWRAAVTGSQQDLFAQINQAVAAVLGTLDLRNVTARLEDRTFTATGATLALSRIAVATLKQSFGVTVAQGQTLGTVDLTGTISGVF